MSRQLISDFAERVMTLLNGDQRKWEYRDIMEATGLDERELAAAIGWLVHQDRVQLELDKEGDKAYLYLMANVYIG